MQKVVYLFFGMDYAVNNLLISTAKPRKVWCNEENSDYRSLLKSGGYLRRDSRKVERKKYGQPGARKRFQFSKR